MTNSRKWLFSPKAKCRNDIFQDVERHQECKEESSLLLDCVELSIVRIIFLLDTFVYHPNCGHKGQYLHVARSCKDGAFQKARLPVEVKKFSAEGASYCKKQ